VANPRGYKNIRKRGCNESEIGCSEAELKLRARLIESLKKIRRRRVVMLQKMCKMLNCG
jgi:hypothetical protein